jgi:transposase-like protein
LAYQCLDDRVTYFNGQLPVFTHAKSDLASFRLFTSQLVENGSVTQSQICKAFGVPGITVKRACKKLREQGAAAFFVPKVRARASKLTPERLAQAQALLDQGRAVPAISSQLGVLQTTLHKAIGDGRLKKTRSHPLSPPADG